MSVLASVAMLGSRATATGMFVSHNPRLTRMLAIACITVIRQSRLHKLCEAWDS